MLSYGLRTCFKVIMMCEWFACLGGKGVMKYSWNSFLLHLFCSSSKIQRNGMQTNDKCKIKYAKTLTRAHYLFHTSC